MSWFDSVAKFLGAVEEDVPATPEVPQHFQQASNDAISEGRDLIAEIAARMDQRDQAHRVKVFTEEMGAFYRDKAHRNELEAMEARFAAMDKADGTNWRMQKINQWKREISQAEQQGWDEDVKTESRRW